MEKISNFDLNKTKEKCIEIYNNNRRLILKGNNPILVTTTILTEDIIKPRKSHETFSNFKVASENFIDHSYLDAFTMCLNQQAGVHAIIDYIPVEEDILAVLEQISINKRYFDAEIREYLIDNNIGALFSIKTGDTIAGEKIIATEKISSFSFMGITGITKELADRLHNANITNHTAFGGAINNIHFKELGYDFTDDTISYNNLFNIGVLKGKSLTADKIWPRTVELGIQAEDNTNNLERIGEVLIDYFTWIEKELKEKGTFNAMSPMKPKTYKKN